MNEEFDKDLDDYFLQFDNLPRFDNENCPKCGINLDETIDSNSLRKVPLAYFEDLNTANSKLKLIRDAGFDSMLLEKTNNSKIILMVCLKDFEKCRDILQPKNQN
jgi:hypothetical protein